MKNQLPKDVLLYQLSPGKEPLEIIYEVCSEDLINALAAELEELVQPVKAQIIEKDNQKILEMISDRPDDDPVKKALEGLIDDEGGEIEA